MAAAFSAPETELSNYGGRYGWPNLGGSKRSADPGAPADYTKTKNPWWIRILKYDEFGGGRPQNAKRSSPTFDAMAEQRRMQMMIQELKNCGTEDLHEIQKRKIPRFLQRCFISYDYSLDF